MSAVNIGLVLLSAISHSLWNILTQTSKNSRFFSGLKGVWIIFLSAPFLTYYGFSKIPNLIWVFALVSGTIHGIYIYCLSRAYQESDISYVYPIARSAPVFVPVFAFMFLGEIISGFNALGIFLILISIYLLHFDGHIVQGHVDEVSICTEAIETDGSWKYVFEHSQKNITVEKGSITINGVSLTVVDSTSDSFSVAIIPYTYENTNFKNITSGSIVNLEFDILGKYITKMISKNK